MLFWMIPLLDVYKSEETNGNKNSYVMKLAFRVSILIKGCKMEKNMIFELVDEIFEDLHNSDPDFFWHLNKISQDVSSIDILDFREDVLHKSVKESARVWSNIIKSAENLDEKTKIPFTNGGKIFVRRWIADGFVGVLSKNSLKYVWDLMFLHSWSRKILKTVTFAILMLLKPWMKRARCFRRMRNVFMKEPFLLYVMDIKRAITHFQSGENLQNFPESSNWKLKEYLPEEEREPYWKPLKFRRNSKVTKLRSDSLTLNVENIGKISSRFARTDSVSSIESIEEIDEEPWLRLWQPYDDQYDANLPSKPTGLTGTLTCT